MSKHFEKGITLGEVIICGLIVCGAMLMIGGSVKFCQNANQNTNSDPLKMAYEELAIGMDYDVAMKIIGKYYSQKPIQVKKFETPDGKQGMDKVWAHCKPMVEGKQPATILLVVFHEIKISTIGIFHTAHSPECREQ